MELITQNVGMLFVLVCNGGLWEFEKIAGAGRCGNVGRGKSGVQRVGQFCLRVGERYDDTLIRCDWISEHFDERWNGC